MDKDKLIEFAKEQCEIFPEDSYMGEYLRETLKMLQAEPCEDAISREDVIKTVDHHTFNVDDGLCLDEDISIILEELPPVKPTRKKGKWIVEVWNNKEHHTCSNCQHLIDYEPCYHYCPICGAEMESEV